MHSAVGVLGPMEVRSADGTVELGGKRQRRLLAALASAAPEVVSVDALSEIVWDGAPPDGANRTLQSYISRLRRTLEAAGLRDGEQTVARDEPGYALRVDRSLIDAAHFEDLLDAATSATAANDPSTAVALLDEAEALWRGSAYAEFAGETWIQPELERLEELHILARHERVDARLALGAHAEVMADLERMVREHPLRERTRSQLMLALYRSGRQAESLRAYQAYRELLSDELGLEPSDELRRLEQQIAAQDSTLLYTAATGQSLRGYWIFEELGSGAFATVYRGTQPSVGREVALKVIRAELANRPEFIRAFEVEAQLIASLEHPHIVPLYDYWREPDRAFLAMRLMRGGRLETLLETRALSVVEARTMVTQIADALAHAHRAGVVHRDVKAANVLLDDDGNYYLGDFGIATESSDLPIDNTVLSVGSPAYAAPEQLRGERVGAAADIFGFAVLVFEALTGKSPFARDSQRQLIESPEARALPPVSGVRPDLPQSVDTVLQRATAADPGERQPNIGTLADEILAALGAGARFDEARARATLIGGATGINPYKGLRAFGEADADDFFGRAELATELAEHVRGSRFLVVTGPSGAGKSSVVRAGLTPRVRRDGNLVATITPGSHPMDEIETALHRLSAREPGRLLEQLLGDERGLSRAVRQTLPADESELVLIIDQFEELFTLASPSDGDQFLAALAYAVSEPKSRLRVVATLRADFYDRPLQHPSISELVRENTVAVTPLSSAQLEQAITQPANRTGVSMDPALVAELVGEVSGQPASLPLLQYALTETYERRVGGTMTLEVYRELGGIAGALAFRADQLIQELGPEGEEHVRRLFTRLISLGEGSEDTRRRVTRVELATIDSTVIDEYGSARLLTFDRDPTTREPTVEVAHEALIREWPRLGGWLDEDRDGLRLLRRLGVAASEWDESGRPTSELYRGGRLEAAEEWAADHPDDLTDREREFLEASQRRRAAQEDEERRSVRRLRRVLEITTAIAIVAVVAGFLAFQQSGRANDKAEEAQIAEADAERHAQIAGVREEDARAAEAAAEIGRLASQAGFLVQSNRQAGLLLAVEAYDRDEGGPVGVGALQRALTGLGNYLGTVADGTPVASVNWLDDGRLLAVGPDGISVIRADGGEPVSHWDDSPLILRLDPGDGALITHTMVEAASDTVAVVAEDDRTSVVVRDLSTGDGEGLVLSHDDDVDGIAVSPDGREVVSIDENDILRAFDALSGRVIWRRDAHPERIFADLGAPEDVEPNLFYLEGADPDGFTTEKAHHHIRFSADGSELITQEGVLRRWDAATGRQVGEDVLLWRHRPGFPDVRVVSPPLLTFMGDRVGDEVIVHDQSGLSRIDLVSGEVVADFGITEAADAYALAKIDTVRWLGGEKAWVLLTDGRILTVSVEDGRELALPIDTQVSIASDLAVSSDGRRAAVSGASGVAIFALDGSRVLARGLPRNDTQTGSITPDGRFVTQDYANGEEWSRPGQIWDVTGNVPVLVDRPDDLLVQHSAGVGNAYKVVTRDYFLRLADLETREYLGPPVEIAVTWSGQTATPDNRWLAAGTGSSGTVVYEVASGDVVASLDELGNSVASLSFNPDGSRLAAATGRGEAMVWETQNWTVVDDDLGDEGRSVISLRYSPDDEFLVTVDAAGNVAVLDATTHETLRVMVGSRSPNIADGLFFFADDGQYLVTAFDSTARLWDLAAGLAIGDPFPNDANNRIGGADGLPRFVTAVGRHRLIWELHVDSWRELACQAAGRNMTREEWAEFGPRGGYERTCEQWPAAPALGGPTTGFQRPEPLTFDADLELLGVEARDDLIVSLETGDTAAARILCETWAGRLGAAVDDLPPKTVASQELLTVLSASELCAGQSYERALTFLINAREGNVCGGYPSPCPESR